MTTSTTLDDLRRASLDELEALFRAPREPRRPAGCYRGHHLVRLDNVGARDPAIWLGQTLGFRLFPFGVDFDLDHWFFFHPRLAAGRFTASIGPSRWRDTEAVTLHYGVSRLPRWVRGALYDEVQPLSDRLILGLGGTNAERGLGDHFFFALERM